MMKIKFWDRLILFFGAVLSVATGAWMIVAGVEWLMDESSSMSLLPRVMQIVLGGLTVLLGVYLFAFPKKFSYRKRDFVVQHTDNGELRIAVKAIENLVQKCIDMHEEIHMVSLKIRNNRDGVTVDLCIALANNIAIPLAVASLQKQIKQYLVASSGIEVKEVRVSVETMQTGVGESPYLVNSDEAKTETVTAPIWQEKKKQPLHQRLFRRGDQPVTVPEPPKEDIHPIPEAQAPQEDEQISNAVEETAEETVEKMVEETENAPSAEKEEDAHE